MPHPYFRVFNPLLQGEKFDPEGAYVRRWVPELKRLPAPLDPPPLGARRLKSTGVELGRDYPEPVIDHKTGREGALTAYARLCKA
jgi:deoxyribodipyrimidine photo-lyase